MKKSAWGISVLLAILISVLIYSGLEMISGGSYSYLWEEEINISAFILGTALVLIGTILDRKFSKTLGRGLIGGGIIVIIPFILELYEESSLEMIFLSVLFGVVLIFLIIYRYRDKFE